MALGRGDRRGALDRAKEASAKERSLIRQREQAGLNDAHNLDLTFSVSKFNNQTSEVYLNKTVLHI